MIARRDFFPPPLSWQAQVTPPAWEADKVQEPTPNTWREQLGSPQTKVILALGIGMVFGWIIKRRR